MIKRLKEKNDHGDQKDRKKAVKILMVFQPQNDADHNARYHFHIKGHVDTPLSVRRPFMNFSLRVGYKLANREEFMKTLE